MHTWGLGLRATAGWGPPAPPLPGHNVSLERIWNASASLMPSCVAEHADDPFACLFPEVSLPYVLNGTSGIAGAAPVRTLVINSLYDAFQEGAIWGTGCGFGKPGHCSDEAFAAAQHYRDALLAAVRSTRPSGAFLSACAQHEQACRDFDVSTIHADGVTMQAAIAAFVHGADEQHVNPPGSKASLGGPGWPGDGSCVDQSGDGHGHGWC